MRIAFVLFSLSWFLQVCVLQRSYFNHWSNYYQNSWATWIMASLWLISAEASAVVICSVLSKHVSWKWARWVAVFIVVGLAALMVGTIITYIVAPSSPGIVGSSTSRYLFLSAWLAFIGATAAPAATLIASLPLFRRVNWTWEWLAAYLLLAMYVAVICVWQIKQWSIPIQDTFMSTFNVQIMWSIAEAIGEVPWYHMGELLQLLSGLGSLALGLWIVYATRPASIAAASDAQA